MDVHTNYTMLCDFYELSMANGYFRPPCGTESLILTSSSAGFPRRRRFCHCGGAGTGHRLYSESPLHRGRYCLSAGQERLYRGVFGLSAHLSVHRRHLGGAGRHPPIFSGEPILTVRAPAVQAQFIETYLLLELNHQSPDRHQGQPHRPGSRRAAGGGIRFPPRPSGAIWGPGLPLPAAPGPPASRLTGITASPPPAPWPTPGSRCSPTSIPHSRPTARLYPNSATLLVDTYNVLPLRRTNAIRVFKEVLEPQGISQCGIRLDSGDLAYLSRKARKMLTPPGCTSAKSWPPTRWTSTLSRTCCCRGQDRLLRRGRNG